LLLVAGTVNSAALPVGAEKIGLNVQGAAGVQLAAGSPAKASSVPVPPTLAAWTIHTTAEAGSGPLDVTTGDPELKGKLPELLAMFASPGLSELLAPNRNTCRYPA
jgi:hypothetical protein